MNSPAITLSNVFFSHHTSAGPLPVLHDVSLEVGPGELVAILGPSGCGKSSLLSLVPGLNVPERGSVRVGLSSDSERSPHAIGMVFQDPVLFDWRTAFENVALPLEIRHGDASVSRDDEIGHRVVEALDRVKLSGFEEHYPNELSGGMQARVAIARALVTNPDVIIMDEPFASLDDITRSTLNLTLLDVKRTTRAAILFVTHSITEAVLLADRVIMLSRRPATVVLDMPIDFKGMPRNEALTESPRFIEYVHSVRLALKRTAA